MVSIKDIANRCNVSVSTVSKALNDQSDVSKAMKEKVLKVAEEMGYTPNIAAKALRTNRTYNIGVLYTDHSSAIPLTHEYFSSVLESFRNEADKNGYDITFITKKIAGKKTTYLNHSIYRNFDGVAIINADYSKKEVAQLANSKFPVVAVDYRYNNCAAVLSDNMHGISELVKLAYRKGHRKIAFIHGESTSVTSDRLNAFYNTCRELGIDVPDNYVLEGKYRDSLLCIKHLKYLLNLEDKPTCILFPDDFAFVGCLEKLQELGISIPEDVSILGYDGIYLSKVFGLTTYAQNTEALGRISAQKLINMIEDSSTEPEHVIVSGKIQEGRTLKEV